MKPRLVAACVAACSLVGTLGTTQITSAEENGSSPITVILSVPTEKTSAEFVRSCESSVGKWCLSNLVLNGMATVVVEGRHVVDNPPSGCRFPCFVRADGSPILANYIFSSDGGRIPCVYQSKSAVCAYMTGGLQWKPVGSETEPTDPIRSVSFDLTSTDAKFESQVGLLLTNAPIEAFAPSTPTRTTARFRFGRPERRGGSLDREGKRQTSAECGWLMFYGIEKCEPAHRVSYVGRSLQFFLFPSASVPDPGGSAKPTVLEEGVGTQISTNAQAIGIPTTNGSSGIYTLQMMGPHYACGYEETDPSRCSQLVQQAPGYSTALATCPPTCPPVTDWPSIWTEETTILNKAYIEWFWPKGFLKRNFGLEPETASDETLIIERTVKKASTPVRSTYTPSEAGLLVKSEGITFSAPILSVRRQVSVSRNSRLSTKQLRALLGSAMIDRSSKLRFVGSSKPTVSVAPDGSSIRFSRAGKHEVSVVVDRGRGKTGTLKIRIKVR